MAIEAVRGCGYRKVGGLYLVADHAGAVCGGLPAPLRACVSCGQGVKPARGWTWIKPASLGLADAMADRCERSRCVATSADQWIDHAAICPARAVGASPQQAGLLWVGSGFYATPADFVTEAAQLGISRRIPFVPQALKLGQTWVLLAHRHACPVQGDLLGDATDARGLPGIFSAFKPQRLEMLVTESRSQDDIYMARLRQRGITPVVVPDDDQDHMETRQHGTGD